MLAGIDARDIDAAQIAASSIIYLEGYLWDPKNAKDAFVKAAELRMARAARSR